MEFEADTKTPGAYTLSFPEGTDASNDDVTLSLGFKGTASDDSPGTGVQSTVRDTNPGKLFQISGTYTYDWEVNEADEVIVSLEWDDVGTGAAAQASGRFAAGTDDAFTASKILAYQYEPASTPGYVFNGKVKLNQALLSSADP